MNDLEKVDSKPLNPLQKFKKNIELMHESGDLSILPSNVSYDSFRNAAVVAFQDSTKIQGCTQESIFRSLRKLAASGLVPDGREAALVPFKKECTAMPMVYGILKIARNTGGIKSIWGETVRKGETLKVWIEDGERKFDHQFDPLDRDEEVIGAYAVAKMDNGVVEFKSMTHSEIEKRRKAGASQMLWDNGRPTGKSDTPIGNWKDWYPEMSIKTLLHSLCKGLPLSSEDQNRILAATIDEDNFKDITPDAPREPKPNLADQLKGKTQTPEDEDQAPLDGEIVAYEEDLVDADTEAFTKGHSDFTKGVTVDANPYKGNPDFSNWSGGWMQAKVGG